MDYLQIFLKYELNLVVQEEHYVWKLHFSWPQVSCVSGYPIRGTRAVFVTFKDSLGEVGNIMFDLFCHEKNLKSKCSLPFTCSQIQKFGFRFLTISETEAFINALKVAFKILR